MTESAPVRGATIVFLELVVTGQATANRLISYWTKIPGNLRGILWMSAGAFVLVISDVFVKILGRTFNPIEITFFRYVVGLTILSPVFLKVGWGNLKTQRFGLHMTRMLLAFVAQISVFISIIYLPLADATAIMFSKPLFTTVVAVFLLKEVVGGRRWAATFVGFVGVMVMMRPGSGAIDPIALIAVGSALTFAIANVLIRMMSTTEPTYRMLFYYHIGGVLILVAPAIWVWKTPVGVEWLLLVAIGVLTTTGMVCYFRAFSAGEANAVGPAENMRLIYAALFGFFIFQEIPSIWTGVGAVIIVAATYYIARSEARRG